MLAPALKRLSMVRATYSSLPGMGLALTITVSPAWISTKRWSRLAILARPAIGSPWAPVVAITRRLAGVDRLALGTGRGDYEAIGRRRSDLVLADDLSRSEEHTAELQSRQYLVCRLLLE